MSTYRQHPFFWIVVVAATAIAILYIAVGTVIYRYGALSKNLGWECEYEASHCIVQSVDANGLVAGQLRVGDAIVAINGNPPVPAPDVMRFPTIAFPSGETYTLTVLRGAERIDFRLRANVEKSFENLPSILIPIVSSLVFFFVALFIGLARPDQRFSQLFSFTWFSIGLLFMAIAIEPMRNLLGRSELNLGLLILTLSMAPIHGATAYHFCYRFPPGIPESRFWSFLRNLFYVWAGSVTLLLTIVRVAILYDANNALRLVAEHHRFSWVLDRSAELVMVVSLVAICALIVRNLFHIHEVNERRRLRWVFFGCLAGTIPTMIFFVSKLALNTLNHETWLTDQCLYVLSMVSNIALELIPLSIGYAIIRHRMYDINVVVRQGLRYLLAKNFLRTLLYLPPAVLIYTILKNRDQNITDVLFSNGFYVLLTVAAVFALKFRNRFSLWLDRKFFREAYNSEKILVSLIEEIKNLNSISEMSKWVTTQLDSALHPKQVLVFYRTKDKGDLALGHSSGDHSHNLSIPSDSRFLRIAEAIGEAHEFPSKATNAVPPDERDWLHHLGTHLIVPMQDSDQNLVGVLLLGEKKSEEPYTVTDRKMLEALAGQIAMIWENLLLKEHVDQELRIKREVLSHFQESKRNLVKECAECGRCYDMTVVHCEYDGRELVFSVPVERVVDGKYRLEKLLGRGGMGAVYQATDLRLTREVALKVLIGSMFGDRLAFRRFEREARASAKLAHPNITTVYDFGSLEGEGAYLVMELLHGFTLRSYLNENGNVEPAVAAAWFDQILEGTKAAHQNGIIHRDLKPENILLASKEEKKVQVKLLDFGLAKTKFIEPADSKSLTAPGTVLGTLQYMSPEQIFGGEVDERTDLFSIGVMVIEALTGKQPFTGQTSSDVALSIIQKPFRLEGEGEQIEVFNAVLQKCIAKNRNNRYESAAKMQSELIPALRNAPPFPSPLAAPPAVARSAAGTRIVV